MWLITLRDLQWRRRRFAFGVVGTALVFAVTLLLAGFSAAVKDEARNTVVATGADGWVVKDGVSGPFSGLSALPETAVQTVAGFPGVRAADPLVIAFATLERAEPTDVTMFGHRPGGMGPPQPRSGRTPAARGEVLVDESLGLRVGERVSLSGRPFTVVGEVVGLTLRGGAPNVYVPVEDAQAIAFESLPLLTTVITHGLPAPGTTLVLPATEQIPALAVEVITAEEARADLLRLFAEALDAVDLLRLLLWVVAAAIVGTVIYLSVMDRLQDFAVLKAIGTRSRTLLGSLALQAVLLAVLAAAVALALAQLLAPAFPLPIFLDPMTSLALLGIAVAVGLVASVLGVRRAVRVDPATAFGGP